MELKQDLYIIPLSKGNLIYSPLRRGMFWANDEASQIVQHYLKGDKDSLVQADNPVVKYIKQLEKITVDVPQQDSEKFNKNSLVVIPSQICNLACSYCYAHKAHAGEYIIDKSMLAMVYDYVLRGKDKNKYFTFIGGGEPMTAWGLLKWSFDYITSHKANNNVFFNITTNATLFNEDIISSVKRYGVHINVSSDILKEVQDMQRPFQNNNKSSFDIIHKNIRLLDENDIPYSIRSTITLNNVSLMPKMVQFAVENYHNLKSMHFEPVTGHVKTGSEYYNEYIDSFFQARIIAKSHGIDLHNSITRSVFNISERSCNGEMCITPTGHIVACHRVSSMKDSHFNEFCYGKVTETGIEILTDKYKNFLRLSNKKGKNCKQCFAHWHCTGICPIEQVTLTEEQLKSRCEFIREIIKKILLENLNK